MQKQTVGEIEKPKLSFDGKLCGEYSRQELLEFDNSSSSYRRKCRGCFFWDTVYIAVAAAIATDCLAYRQQVYAWIVTQPAAASVIDYFDAGPTDRQTGSKNHVYRVPKCAAKSRIRQKQCSSHVSVQYLRWFQIWIELTGFMLAVFILISLSVSISHVFVVAIHLRLMLCYVILYRLTVSAVGE